MKDEPMTLRDMFALHALPGVMRSIDENGGHGFGTSGTSKQVHRRTALMAYVIADHMIEARKVQPDQTIKAVRATTTGKSDSYDDDDTE